MRTGVHQWPPPSVTCPNTTRAAGGERRRTEVNETETETRPSAQACCRVARFRGLRRAIRHRPPVHRTWPASWFTFAVGQLRTEVNETENGARRLAHRWRGRVLSGRCPVSVEAISWALNLAPVPVDRGGQPSSACKFVLVGLANHAGPDGTGAFPSVATLVRYTGLSERTVRTCLDRLEAEGIIRPCDPDIVAARIKRADRRPQGWTLNLTLVRDDLDDAAIAVLEHQFPWAGHEAHRGCAAGWRRSV